MICEQSTKTGWALRAGAAVASAAILWSACPPAVPGSDGAWFGLVPLLLVVRHTSPRRSFWLGGLCGAVFWLLSLTWLWRLIDNNGPWPLVTIGYAALAAYCALYTALFALAASLLWRAVHARENGASRLAAVVLGEPLLWVGAEYLRSTLFTGFPWQALGVTQHANLGLIQAASWGGVYAVSALVLLVNGAVASMTERVYGTMRRRTDAPPPAAGGWRSLESFVPLVLLLGAVMWGMGRVGQWGRQSRKEPSWQVVLIQPDAPSIFERGDDSSVEAVRATLLAQTALAAGTHPDLVVWPETILMGSLPGDAFAMALASNGAVSAGAPLLTGTAEARLDSAPGAGWRYHNSAWLFTPSGLSCGYYRKQHLVPFGEFIPGECFFPALARLSPIGFSCTAGRESTVLRVTRPAASGGAPEVLALSPLICFEDTVSSLARQAVAAGARLLANVTNDSWFKGSSEPEQHAAQAVFRCVESGVPMVRAANTGVTCTINPVGGRSSLAAPGGAGGLVGFLAAPLAVPREPLPTVYARGGDWVLGRPAALVLLAVLVLGGVSARRRPGAAGGAA